MNLNKIAAGLRLIADGLEDWTEEEKVEAAPAPELLARYETPAAKATTPPPQTAAAPELPVGEDVSAEEVQNLYYHLTQQHGKLDMLPLLTELGIQKVSEATGAQRAALKRRMQETWQG
jgi:hypothetical protein